MVIIYRELWHPYTAEKFEHNVGEHGLVGMLQSVKTIDRRFQ